MEKITTDSKQFSTFRELDAFAASHGFSLSDPAAQEAFLKALSEMLLKHKSNPNMLHGFRIQSMFAYVAAALGGCRIITEEDSGDLFVASSEIKRPDFRILHNSGHEFFVEVKNFYQSDPTADCFSLKSDYAIRLQKYAETFQKPLFIAIYWARWRIWTLNSLTTFSQSGNNFNLSLLDAIKVNHMSLLGDCVIGIPKPFALRLYTDPAQPRRLGLDSQAIFSLHRAVFSVAGREITDGFEGKLAWFFLLYVDWEDFERIAHIESRDIIFIEYKCVRPDSNPDQEFQMIGQLSQMISKQYNDMTVEEGQVHHLSPDVQPEKLGVLIPLGFKGDVLGIWRFTQLPEKSAFPSNHPSVNDLNL